MKEPVLCTLGKWFMRIWPISILIVDDERAYFNPQMIKAARDAGFPKIRRLYKVDATILRELQTRPPDIIVLDIRGVTTDDVAKDGLALADHLRKNTNSYIAVTSAHQYHLTNRITDVDYVIEDRLLTIVDFIEHLNTMSRDCLSRRKRFYQRIGLRMGLFFLRHSLPKST